MKTKHTPKPEVSLWRTLPPCIAAGIVALLLSSAGCGSAASAAETTTKSAVGKVAKKVLASKPSYTATAYLIVRPPDAAPAVAPPLKPEDFAKFVQSQTVLLKSRPVVEAALKDPKVVKLKLGERTDDPVAWLTERLRTTVLLKQWLIDLSLTSDDPAEAATLANAVAGAYMTDVIEADFRQKYSRYDQAERAMEEPTKKMRRYRDQLRTLAEQLGTTDPKALSIKTQVAAEQLSSFQRASAQCESELRKAKADGDSRKAMLAKIAKDGIPEAEVDKAAGADEKMRDDLQPRLSGVEQQLTREKGKDSPDTKKLADLEKQHQKIQSQIAARREELRQRLKQDLPAALELSIMKNELDVASLQTQYKRLVGDTDKKRAQLDQIKKATDELSPLRTEIEQLELVLKGLADQRERLHWEIMRTPRVMLAQKAERPTKAD
jgi:polysaccharide biosynthesis transport protein